MIAVVMTSFTHSLKTSLASIEKQIESLRGELTTQIVPPERDVVHRYRRELGDPPAS
ncbi:hypothetical protein N8K70_02225 [Microbacterium betulae]|uniref:Uncharacterized protein n=1 Tax=Microbacterium betulae TaxID=2981139 RepID=A0AA97I670_9MICO|nr:hypothetical protein [Microbacterium sp. AB]WOF23519.1 hypothetical protein N8K70_02225 [Microbacterium sp. AB]